MALEEQNPDWWRYEQLESKAPYDWSPATRGDREYDQLDFHLDLGCGTVPKARLGIDRFLAPGVDLAIDLERLCPAEQSENSWHQPTVDLYRAMGVDGPLIRRPMLPFPDDSIESIISHHCLEHIRDGFVPLMDECHRVLKPGGIFRIIVPLFPSYSAVADPDHKRYFLEGVFETFCGTSGGEHWMESFSVPYTKSRFQMLDEDTSPPTIDIDQWRPNDAREMRVALRKWD
jgi:SAM-dependent methyltransferase